MEGKRGIGRLDATSKRRQIIHIHVIVSMTCFILQDVEQIDQVKTTQGNRESVYLLLLRPSHNPHPFLLG